MVKTNDNRSHNDEWTCYGIHALEKTKFGLLDQKQTLSPCNKTINDTPTAHKDDPFPAHLVLSQFLRGKNEHTGENKMVLVTVVPFAPLIAVSLHPWLYEALHPYCLLASLLRIYTEISRNPTNVIIHGFDAGGSGVHMLKHGGAGFWKEWNWPVTGCRIHKVSKTTKSPDLSDENNKNGTLKNGGRPRTRPALNVSGELFSDVFHTPQVVSCTAQQCSAQWPEFPYVLSPLVNAAKCLQLFLLWKLPFL